MISVRPAEPHHAEQMHSVETEAFAAPWSAAAIKDEIWRKSSYSFVALDEETVVGHIYMRHIINEGIIINIAVRKSHRRQCIGSRLITAVIEATKNLELIGLTLEVRESNIAAKKLYEKHGFAPEGIRKNYYSNPSEDGVIMWKYF